MITVKKWFVRVDGCVHSKPFVKIISMEQSPSEDKSHSVSQEIPCSGELATGLYPEEVKFFPHVHILFL
jgi:hypothetical protein